jgi:hypothetical protein
MISIGHIAKTYGVLPSEVRSRATSYDIMITDVYSTWERYQQDTAAGKTPDVEYDQDQLKDILERTRHGG